MLFEIILNCFFLWMTFDSLNQVMNVNALRVLHRRIGNTGDVEILQYRNYILHMWTSHDK